MTGIADLEQIGLNIPARNTLDNLILVVGHGRGGSTIVSRSIWTHPQIFGVPYNNKLFRWGLWPPNKSMPESKRIEAAMRTDAVDYDQLNSHLDDHQRETLVDFTKEALAKDDLPGLLKLYPMLHSLSEFRGQTLDAYTHWSIKDNSYYGVKFVKRALPNTKLVFIHRDPMANVLSSATVRAKGRNASLNDSDLVKCAIDWVINTEKFLTLARRYPADSITINFEKFLEQPVQIVNKIFKVTLGDEMPKDILENALQTVQGKGSHHDRSETARGIRQAPKERWRHLLSPHQQDLIAAITAKTARKAGYSLAGKRGGLWSICRVMPDWRSRLSCYLRLFFYRVTGLPPTRRLLY